MQNKERQHGVQEDRRKDGPIGVSLYGYGSSHSRSGGKHTACAVDERAHVDMLQVVIFPNDNGNNNHRDDYPCGKPESVPASEQLFFQSVPSR